MDTFYNVFGFVAAICAGIAILAFFFTGLSWFNQAVRGVEVVKLKGFVRDNRLVNVYMHGGKSSLGVRVAGFSNLGEKGGIPYQLSNMLVLEKEGGARIFIRADRVLIIEEIEDGAERNPTDCDSASAPS